MSSIRASVLFSGVADVKAALRKASRRLSHAGSAGIYAAAAAIIIEAKKRAPVDTGALKSSGYATLPNSSNTVEIGFGGYGQTSHSGAFPEEYAIDQHETDWYNHAIGEAHYLVNAINSALAGRGALVKMAKAAQAAFDGGSITKIVPSTPEEGD